MNNVKFVAKLHNGQWAIFKRTGSRKAGFDDVRQESEYRGTYHIAARIAANLTADARRAA